MNDLASRHLLFRKLHDSGCFVIPNPWDAGSARMMAALGAPALATTSAGHAFTLGKPDMGRVTRDEALAHAQSVVAATALPVSGDFENGYADSPDGVAETVRLAREVGLSGCSIEDTSMAPGNPAYAFELAVERIAAASAAARSLAHPFVLCARADGVMNRTYAMDEALRRIRAFETAGADLVYVPLVPDVDALKQVVAAVSIPVNALAAGAVAGMKVQEIAATGVRRISLGSQIARLTHAAIRDAMRGIVQDGSFALFGGAMGGSAVNELLELGASRRPGG
ncbi:MAG: isocitrate lyase/phosphoenolpyruvate mutase family protein [Pseudomonadota bacterium]|nr:isocitrate lyase/phosphoenolpyruvate mutase family protein [Pseudomonadota bacterium]